jgi:hypothetical protein
VEAVRLMSFKNIFATQREEGSGGGRVLMLQCAMDDAICTRFSLHTNAECVVMYFVAKS